MRIIVLVLACGICAGPLRAQCPDGTLPPCRAPMPAPPRPAAPPAPLSIAVLPFSSRSPDTSQAYLAEGMTDEIANQLTRVARLQVKARSLVVAQWRRTPDPFDAARQLNVTWFVHGSVRQAGPQLLVSVQLVRATTGEESWAQRFPRRADRLNDYGCAEPLLRRAVAIDPDNRNAWRQLGLVLSGQGRLVEAEAVLDTALSLGSWVPGLLNRADIRFLRGDAGGALADLAESERMQGRPDTLWRAEYRVALGRRTEALAASEALPPGMRTWTFLHRADFIPLRSDPRFIRVMEASRPQVPSSW